MLLVANVDFLQMVTIYADKRINVLQLLALNAFFYSKQRRFSMYLLNAHSLPSIPVRFGLLLDAMLHNNTIIVFIYHHMPWQ